MTKRFPLVAIRNAVMFPNVSLPLIIGRKRSLDALSAAERNDGLLIVVTQKVICDEPGVSDLYRVGTLCKIESAIETNAHQKQVVLTGIKRFRIEDIRQVDGMDCVGFTEDAEPSRTPEEDLNSLIELGSEVLSRLPSVAESLIQLIRRVDDLAYLTHIYSAYLNLPLDKKQALLEERSLEVRADRINAYLTQELRVLRGVVKS